MLELSLAEIKATADSKFAATQYRVLYDGQCEIWQACVAWLKTLDHENETVPLAISAEVFIRSRFPTQIGRMPPAIARRYAFPEELLNITQVPRSRTLQSLALGEYTRKRGSLEPVANPRCPPWPCGLSGGVHTLRFENARHH